VSARIDGAPSLGPLPNPGAGEADLFIPRRSIGGRTERPETGSIHQGHPLRHVPHHGGVVHKSRARLSPKIRHRRTAIHGRCPSSHATSRSRRHRRPFGPPVPLMLMSAAGSRPPARRRCTCRSDVDRKYARPARSKKSGAQVACCLGNDDATPCASVQPMPFLVPICTIMHGKIGTPRGMAHKAQKRRTWRTLGGGFPSMATGGAISGPGAKE